jgi:hypothetical protein
MAVTMNETTLAAALTPSDNTITLTSGATVKPGHIAFVDREAMLLQAAVGDSTVQYYVHRGWSGTAARAHIVAAKCKTGPPHYFQIYNPSGAAAATTEAVVPWVNVHTGDVFDAVAGVWKRIGDGGVTDGTPAWP